MNRKTVRLILRKKFDDFLTSIDDKEVAELVKKNTIITGGAIPSLLTGERVNDFDLYFTDYDTVLAVVKYYTTKFFGYALPIEESILANEEAIAVSQDESGVNRVRIRFRIKQEQLETEEGITEEAVSVSEEDKKDDKPKYRPIFLSDNAITLSNGIQIVIRFYGEAEEIHKNYDYVHCTNYWTSKDNQLVLRAEALESLLTKQLKYVGSKYPLASMVRMRKFIMRGWKISAGDIFKIAFNLNHFDLTNIDVLREQLVGVDVAYFNEVLRLLSEKMDKEGTKKVDEAYLMEIVERVFG
jgi:hypothetical protein